MSPENAPAQPLLRIVRGTPTDVELAAVVTVLAARTASAAQRPAPARSRWAAPRPRPVLRHGPGAWQASARSS